MTLTIPFPPALNRYYRTAVIAGRAQTYIGEPGKKYRKAVAETLFINFPHRHRFTGRVAVEIAATMPDRRRRDLDGIPKAALDALTHCGCWDDDSQIDRLTLVRLGAVPPGLLTVTITEI